MRHAFVKALKNSFKMYFQQGYACVCVYVYTFSCGWLFVTPWTVAHQAPLSMEFSRQEYWSGLQFPTQGDLPDPGIKPTSLASLHWFSSVQFSRSVVSDYLRPHGLQHARPPCPSPTPGVYSNSRPSNRWCHPAISSPVVPFSFYIGRQILYHYTTWEVLCLYIPLQKSEKKTFQSSDRKWNF